MSVMGTTGASDEFAVLVFPFPLGEDTARLTTARAPHSNLLAWRPRSCHWHGVAVNHDDLPVIGLKELLNNLAT